MRDNKLTVGDLRDKVASFVNERAWGSYHSPKNLSMSIAIEAAELMELFQWIDVEESRALDRDRRELVEMEMADVAIYLLSLANQLDIDLSSAILKKLKLNEEKYPKEQFKGRYG